MGFPAVEVAFAPATDAFKANPQDISIVKDACEILKSAEGHIEYAFLQSYVSLGVSPNVTVL